MSLISWEASTIPKGRITNSEMILRERGSLLAGWWGCVHVCVCVMLRKIHHVFNAGEEGKAVITAPAGVSAMPLSGHHLTPTEFLNCSCAGQREELLWTMFPSWSGMLSVLWKVLAFELSFLVPRWHFIIIYDVCRIFNEYSHLWVSADSF